MGAAPAFVTKREESTLLTKDDVLKLINEDTAALSARAPKFDKLGMKKIEDFEKSWGLIPAPSGPLDRRAFLNGERFSVRFVLSQELGENDAKKFAEDCSKLAYLGVRVTALPDGTTELVNFNFVPDFSPERKRSFQGMLDNTRKLAEQGNVEQALLAHTAFVSMFDCLRLKSDAEKSAALSSSYLIGGRDVETIPVFLGADGKFSQQKFQDVLDISYADYLKGGFGYAAQMKFTAAATNFDIAATYYANALVAAENNKQAEFRNLYSLAQGVYDKAGFLSYAGLFILDHCRPIGDARDELRNIAELLVASGLSVKYPSAGAEQEIKKQIAAGELKAGNKKIMSMDEIVLQYDGAMKMLQPAVEALFKDIQQLESYQKMLIAYSFTGDSRKVKDILSKIDKIKAGYEDKFKAASNAYLAATLVQQMENFQLAIKQENENKALSNRPAKALLEKFRVLKTRAEGIKNAAGPEDTKQKYDELTAEMKEAGKALFASVAFEEFVQKTKGRFKLADEEKDKQVEIRWREKVPANRRLGEGEFEMERTRKEPALTSQEKELFMALKASADKFAFERAGVEGVDAALEAVQNGYDPFEIMKKGANIDDIREGKVSKIFNLEDGAAANVFRLGMFAQSLYVLSWRARGEVADAKAAVRTLSDFVIPAVDNSKKKSEFQRTAAELAKKDITTAKYQELAGELFETLREEAFRKGMKDKKFIEKIGPYAGYILEKYNWEITGIAIAASLIASAMSAEPAPTLAASTGGRAVVTQAARGIGGAALREVFSPREIAKRMLTKQTVLRGVDWSLYPYIIGGGITGIDGMAKYLASGGGEKELAIQQLRRSLIWTSLGAGGSAMVSTFGKSAAVPSWTSRIRTGAGRAAHAGGDLVLLGGGGVSLFDHVRRDQVDWWGVAGDTSFMLLGGLSMVRGVRGFKTVGDAAVEGTKIKDGTLAFLLNKPAAAGILLVSGSVLYMKESILPEKVVEIKETVASVSRTQSMQPVAAAVKDIGRIRRQVAEQEKKEYVQDMAERVVVKTLFPDVFESYFSERTTVEHRQAALAEIKSRLGLSMKDEDVFSYLSSLMVNFNQSPKTVSLANAQLAQLFKTRTDQINANIKSLKTYIH